jgi:dihydrodipicolinate synthase/N-acetylneuraminate lyase
METKWGWTSEESLIDHQTRARLCAAVLLPFHDGKPDWSGFYKSIRWMMDSAEYYGVELVPVLNADTGYIFQLDNDTYSEVLKRFRSEFPNSKFIAGVTARGADSDSKFLVERYYPLMDLVQEHDNCEVMIMTSRWLNSLCPEERRDGYFAIAERLERPGIVHALEPSFVPWATPFEPWLLWQLASHPKFVGGKVSTLDVPHFLYWSAMCRDLSLNFSPHSGDDFGIATAIKIGMPLLIGAASSSAPLICAAKDMWLGNNVAEKRFPTRHGHFDTRVYKLFEAIQSLEDQVFRFDASESVAAYKHSTAHVLKILGIIQSTDPHPMCSDRRDLNESTAMQQSMIRPRRMAKMLGIPYFDAT